MNITITTRKVTVSDAFRERIEKKLMKLDRFFDADAQAVVTLSSQKNQETAEVTIKYKGMIFRAESTEEKAEAAFDQVIDRIVRQIRKNKTKLQKRLHLSGAPDFGELPETPADEEEIYDVIKVKKFGIKPMNVEEAILQMNMLGHAFFVFNNIDDGAVNVVYRRRDGNYGVLIPQNS